MRRAPGCIRSLILPLSYQAQTTELSLSQFQPLVIISTIDVPSARQIRSLSWSGRKYLWLPPRCRVKSYCMTSPIEIRLIIPSIAHFLAAYLSGWSWRASRSLEHFSHKLVEIEGLKPSTSAMRMLRSINWAISPCACGIRLKINSTKRHRLITGSVVDLAGLEPATSRMWIVRSSQLS